MNAAKPLRILTLLIIGAAACGATTATVTITPKVKRPVLVLRASRVMAFPGAPILLSAVLEGGDDAEALYCPSVVWTWADGTESGEEGDCPAFAAGVEYPRRWTRWITLSMPGTYPISVRLEKPAGRVVARATLTLTGLGGE
jgi:hypothetical protein